MYRLCTTERSAQQQRRIEATLVELMLEEDYENITVSEICLKCGLSRKVFYRLFDKKNDVLDAMLDHIFLDFMVYEPNASVGAGGLHAFFAFWVEQKALLDALEKNELDYLLTERALTFIFAEDAERLRHFGADIDEFGREIMLFYVSGLFSLVYDWHDHGYDKSVDQMCTLIMKLFSSAAIKSGNPPENW